MNEITKIHLGRQAFTIAVDAYKALQAYLHAIKRQAGGSDVAEEVELRMAELLLERGVSGDKVVLVKDVEYLKEQLGEPDAFGDSDGDGEQSTEETGGPKRLFRDTQNGMIAGVCAGIAKYLGTDPAWVRLAFVALVLLGASGILLYIVLWLIVPEAKTNSDRLQMHGRPVNVDTIKEVVERADVKGAAVRAQHAVGKAVQTGLKVLLGAVGVALMIAAIAALLGLTTGSVYWALNHDLVPAGIFPATASEVLLVILGVLFLAILIGFVLVGGLALVKRKWPLPGWAVGAMIAVWLACAAVGSALAADAVPNIRERYEAAQHSYTLTVPAFHKLSAVGMFDAGITYQEASDYSVTVAYWGDVETSNMKAEVKNDTLYLDSEALLAQARCQTFCLFRWPIKQITVHGPQLQEVTADLLGGSIDILNAHDQTLKVRATNSSVTLSNITADVVRAERAADNTWTLGFSGAYLSTVAPQEVYIYEDTATIAVRTLDLSFEGICGVRADLSTGTPIYLSNMLQSLTLNGRFIGSRAELNKAFDKPGMSPEKCLGYSDQAVNYYDIEAAVRAEIEQSQLDQAVQR